MLEFLFALLGIKVAGKGVSSAKNTLHNNYVKPVQELGKGLSDLNHALTTHPCPHCLARIPNAASVCSFCGRDVKPK